MHYYEDSLFYRFAFTNVHTGNSEVLQFQKMIYNLLSQKWKRVHTSENKIGFYNSKNAKGSLIQG